MNGQEMKLGKMPSMSAECTPAKHRYDDCFNKWFEDYLGLSSKENGNRRNGDLTNKKESRNTFWSSSSTSSSQENNPIEAIQGGVQRTSTERKALRDRLEGECGKFWKEYQSCVLVSLISEMRFFFSFK